MAAGAHLICKSNAAAEVELPDKEHGEVGGAGLHECGYKEQPPPSTWASAMSRTRRVIVQGVASQSEPDNKLPSRE